MAANPNSIFYWNDWVLDPTLRQCSMAAQGFWMQLLAIAATATPRGHVKVGDKPCSICDLARITGQHKRSVSSWVRELERNGVFSRTEEGTIFCRRMVREAAKGVRHKRLKEARTSHPLDSDKLLKSAELSKKTHTRAPDSDSKLQEREDIYIHVGEDAARVGEPGEPGEPGERPPSLSRYDLLIAITREAALKCERERLRNEAAALWREDRCGGADPPGERLWGRPAAVEPKRTGMDRGGQARAAGYPP